MPTPAVPTAQFDTPWKALLERFLEPCLALAFPALHALIDWRAKPRFLDKELQQIAPEHAQGRQAVDTLVDVRLKGGRRSWLLVHAEVQAQPDRGFPRRMWVYHYRIWDRYQRPAASVAVLADGEATWRPHCYHQEVAGCVEHFEFPVFKVLDYADPEGEFTRTGNPFALLVAAQQAALRTRGDAAARAGERFRLVRYLYGRGLRRADVLALFRLVEWLTMLPAELELKFRWRLARFEKKKKVMTAETLLAPVELILLERSRKAGHREGLKRGALIGRIENCQDLLQLPVAPMEELAEQPTKALQAELRRLEAALRRQLRGASCGPSNGSPGQRR
jgi:hypothetical protein